MAEERSDIGPLIGMMMVVMMLSILPKMIGGEGPTPTQYANLTGIVYDSTNSQPLSSAYVYLAKDGDYGNRIHITTGDGKYEFTSIPVGIYDLVVLKSGYITKVTMSVLTSPILYTQDVVLVPDTGTDFAHLTGVVYNSQTGQRIQGAQVKLGSDTVYTDSNGIYSFIDKNPGTHTLSVISIGYNNYSIQITLGIGDNTKDIYLNPEGTPIPLFSVSNLDVQPSEVYVGEEVIISADVHNTGDVAGSVFIGDTQECDIVLSIVPSTYQPAGALSVPVTYPLIVIDDTPTTLLKHILPYFVGIMIIIMVAKVASR